jgi:anti-sigma regulatory factor (Ser/Thr protein kinase)
VIRLAETIAVTDSSQIAAARRLATQTAESLGLGETAVGKAALVVTELATNLLKHGQGGSILFGSAHDARSSLAIVALDRGRGIANVKQAMEDGYSTAGSAGTGLGAISRNASFVDMYTQPDRGTAIYCRIDDSPKHATLSPPELAIGGICIPKRGEDQSGDAWVAISGSEFTTVAIADGLGHGAFAATASTAAVRVIAGRAEQPLELIAQEAHGALRPTRGAAVGIARIHPGPHRVDFLGVGNIAGAVVSDESTRRTVSLNGIVGHEMRRVQTFSYPWNGSSALVLASDGIATSWNTSSYPGLLQRDPALIASVLFRDFCRGNDDATVVVVKSV